MASSTQSAAPASHSNGFRVGPDLDHIIESRLGLPPGSMIAFLAGKWAKRIFGYRKAAALMNALRDARGAEAFDALEMLTGITVETFGVDIVPQNGAALLVANHPTGAPDGVALWAAVKARRRDISFVSSTEAVSFLQGVDNFILPVDLSGQTPTALGTRQLAHALARAIRQGRLIVVTPAARITPEPYAIEPVWHEGYAQIAARFKLPVIAAHISARNAPSYYLAGKFSKALQELLVFRQLINRRGVPLRISFDTRLHRIDDPCEAAAFNQTVRTRLFDLDHARD